VALCAQCHKAPESVSPTSPSFIRFQAPTLVQSRCYTESGTLSCVTCHNPHKNASRTASDYEALCLECHPSVKGQDRQAAKELAREKTWAPCPTGAERDCLSCHMPRIKDAVPRTIFTDHFIRVRKEADSPAQQ
jgi:predicted CXXCH cytochrome family protein